MFFYFHIFQPANGTVGDLETFYKQKTKWISRSLGNHQPFSPPYSMTYFMTAQRRSKVTNNPYYKMYKSIKTICVSIEDKCLGFN